MPLPYPIKLPIVADTRHFTTVLDIFVRHLSALRDELAALDADKAEAAVRDELKAAAAAEAADH